MFKVDIEDNCPHCGANMVTEVGEGFKVFREDFEFRVPQKNDKIQEKSFVCPECNGVWYEGKPFNERLYNKLYQIWPEEIKKKYKRE